MNGPEKEKDFSFKGSMSNIVREDTYSDDQNMKHIDCKFDNALPLGVLSNDNYDTDVII